MIPELKVLVEIEPGELKAIRFTDKKTGQPRSIYAQVARVYVDSAKHAERREIIHNAPTDALAAGRYMATRLRLNRNGVEVDLSALTLVPGSAVRSA